MKKALLMILAAILAASSLAGCSRRGQYEDQLESQKVAESLDAIPETNDNITGENAPDYQTPIMLKTGDTPFYEGKTVEELKAVFRSSSTRSDPTVTPTGRMYRTYDENMWYYNKLTGNFSAWCADPLCNVVENENCIWYDFLWILYISDEYLSSVVLDEVIAGGKKYGTSVFPTYTDTAFGGVEAKYISRLEKGTYTIVFKIDEYSDPGVKTATMRLFAL